MAQVDARTTTRRRFVSLTTAAAAVLPTGINAAAGDPIFALIERAGAAYRAMDEDCQHSDKMSDVLSDAWDSTMTAVLSTPPTTMAGVIAALHFAGGEMVDGCRLSDSMAATDEDLYDAACNFLPMISAALRRLAGR